MRNVPHIRPMVIADLKQLHNINSAIVADEGALNHMLYSSKGNCHTFLVNGEPAAVVGASCLWEGVWQVWAMVTNEIRGHGLYFTKTCQLILDKSAKYYDVKRYNIIVDSTDKEHIRWAKLLGFQYEYTMVRASVYDTDVLGYVKFMKGE